MQDIPMRPITTFLHFATWFLSRHRWFEPFWQALLPPTYPRAFDKDMNALLSPRVLLFLELEVVVSGPGSGLGWDFAPPCGRESAQALRKTLSIA